MIQLHFVFNSQILLSKAVTNTLLASMYSCKTGENKIIFTVKHVLIPTTQKNYTMA
jgi:hypothetical protein